MDSESSSGSPKDRVKLNVKPVDGVIKWFQPDKGFGFITRAANDEPVFMHRSNMSVELKQVVQSGRCDGTKVQFDLARGKEGLEAINVTYNEDVVKVDTEKKASGCVSYSNSRYGSGTRNVVSPEKGEAVAEGSVKSDPVHQNGNGNANDGRRYSSSSSYQAVDSRENRNMSGGRADGVAQGYARERNVSVGDRSDGGGRYYSANKVPYFRQPPSHIAPQQSHAPPTPAQNFAPQQAHAPPGQNPYANGSRQSQQQGSYARGSSNGYNYGENRSENNNLNVNNRQNFNDRNNYQRYNDRGPQNQGSFFDRREGGYNRDQQQQRYPDHGNYANNNWQNRGGGRPLASTYQPQRNNSSNNSYAPSQHDNRSFHGSQSQPSRDFSNDGYHSRQNRGSYGNSGYAAQQQDTRGFRGNQQQSENRGRPGGMGDGGAGPRDFARGGYGSGQRGGYQENRNPAQHQHPRTFHSNQTSSRYQVGGPGGGYGTADRRQAQDNRFHDNRFHDNRFHDNRFHDDGRNDTRRVDNRRNDARRGDENSAFESKDAKDDRTVNAHRQDTHRNGLRRVAEISTSDSKDAKDDRVVNVHRPETQRNAGRRVAENSTSDPKDAKDDRTVNVHRPGTHRNGLRRVAEISTADSKDAKDDRKTPSTIARQPRENENSQSESGQKAPTVDNPSLDVKPDSETETSSHNSRQMDKKEAADASGGRNGRKKRRPRGGVGRPLRGRGYPGQKYNSQQRHQGPTEGKKDEGKIADVITTDPPQAESGASSEKEGGAVAPSNNGHVAPQGGTKAVENGSASDGGAVAKGNGVHVTVTSSSPGESSKSVSPDREFQRSGSVVDKKGSYHSRNKAKKRFYDKRRMSNEGFSSSKSSVSNSEEFSNVEDDAPARAVSVGATPTKEEKQSGLDMSKAATSTPVSGAAIDSGAAVCVQAHEGDSPDDGKFLAESDFVTQAEVLMSENSVLHPEKRAPLASCDDSLISGSSSDFLSPVSAIVDEEITSFVSEILEKVKKELDSDTVDSQSEAPSDEPDTDVLKSASEGRYCRGGDVVGDSFGEKPKKVSGNVGANDELLGDATATGGGDKQKAGASSKPAGDKGAVLTEQKLFELSDDKDARASSVTKGETLSTINLDAIDYIDDWVQKP